MNRSSRVESQREVHVLFITLQREHKRNATDKELANALDAAPWLMSHRQMPMPPRSSLERLADLAFG